MSKKEKKPEDVTPEEQTEQAVPTEETEAEAPNSLPWASPSIPTSTTP